MDEVNNFDLVRKENIFFKPTVIRANIHNKIKNIWTYVLRDISFTSKINFIPLEIFKSKLVNNKIGKKAQQ